VVSVNSGHLVTCLILNQLLSSLTILPLNISYVINFLHDAFVKYCCLPISVSYHLVVFANTVFCIDKLVISSLHLIQYTAALDICRL